MPPRHARPDDPERGSVSAWVATTAVAALLLVGIAVDFGGQVHAQQHARDVAAQAARAGGEQVAAASAIRGVGASVDPTAAYQAAATYLAGSGVEGSVSVVDATIVVTTSAPYATKVLGIVGIDTLPATGHAEARIARVVEGVEQ